MNENVMGDIKLASYATMLPELYLCVWTLFLLVYGVYRFRNTTLFVILTGLLLLGVTGWLVGVTGSAKTVVMNGMFISDRFAVMAKALIVGSSALVLTLASGWLREERDAPLNS